MIMQALFVEVKQQYVDRNYTTVLYEIPLKQKFTTGV